MGSVVKATVERISDERGLGLVATRHLADGDVILEQPALYFCGSNPDLVRNRLLPTYHHVARYFDHLKKAAESQTTRPTKAEISKLLQTIPGLASPENQKYLVELGTLVGEWAALDDDTKTLHLFGILSLLEGARYMPDSSDQLRGYSFYGGIVNHACIPNAIMSQAVVERPAREGTWAEGFITIKALRAIQQGDEITVAYDLRTTLNPDIRQRQLLEEFGFQCRCVTCVHGSPDLREQMIFAHDTFEQFKDDSLSISKRYRLAFNYLAVARYLHYKDYAFVLIHDTLSKLAMKSGDDLRAKFFVMLAVDWCRKHLSVGHNYTERHKDLLLSMESAQIPSVPNLDDGADDALLYMSDHDHEDDTYYWLRIHDDELEELDKDHSDHISKLKREERDRTPEANAAIKRKGEQEAAAVKLKREQVAAAIKLRQERETAAAKEAAEKAAEDACKALLADLNAEGTASAKNQKSAAKKAAKRREASAKHMARKQAKDGKTSKSKTQPPSEKPPSEKPSMPEADKTGPSGKVDIKNLQEQARKKVKRQKQWSKQRQQQQQAGVSQPDQGDQAVSEQGLEASDHQVSTDGQVEGAGSALPATPPPSSPLSSEERETPATEARNASPVVRHPTLEDQGSVSAGVSDRSETVGWPTPPGSPAISDEVPAPIFEFVGFGNKLERRLSTARFDECDLEQQSWANTNAYPCETSLVSVVYDGFECDELSDVFADSGSWSRIDGIVENVSPYRFSGRVWESFRAAKWSDPCDGEPTLLSLPFERPKSGEANQFEIGDHASEIETDPCGGDCFNLALGGISEEEHHSQELDVELVITPNNKTTSGVDELSINKAATSPTTAEDITALSSPRSPLRRALPGTRLYVGNLLDTVSCSDVKTFFTSNGFVPGRINISISPKARRNISYAFVDLETAEEASRAMEMLNGMEMSGRKVNINPAATKRERSRREPRVRKFEGSRDGSLAFPAPLVMPERSISPLSISDAGDWTGRTVLELEEVEVANSVELPTAPAQASEYIIPQNRVSRVPSNVAEFE